VALTATPI